MPSAAAVALDFITGRRRRRRRINRTGKPLKTAVDFWEPGGAVDVQMLVAATGSEQQTSPVSPPNRLNNVRHQTLASPPSPHIRMSNASRRRRRGRRKNLRDVYPYSK